MDISLLSLDRDTPVRYRSYMNLGKRLLQARKIRGMKQSEVAELASQIGGVPLSQAAYQKLETRGSQSSIYLFAMAKALRVNPEWLQTGHGESGLDQARTGTDEDILQFIVQTWRYADDSGKRWIEEAARFIAHGHATGPRRDKQASRGRGDVAARIPAAGSRRAQKS